MAELGADADLIVAIGGDGTLLFAAQLALGRGVPLLGVNRGRLGFLTDVLPDEMIGNLDAVLEGRYETDERAAARGTAHARGRTSHATTARSTTSSSSARKPAAWSSSRSGSTAASSTRTAATGS